LCDGDHIAMAMGPVWPALLRLREEIVISLVTEFDVCTKSACARVTVALAACLLTGCNFDNTPTVPGGTPATVRRIQADAYVTYRDNPPHDHAELDAWSKWRAEIDTRTTWRDWLNGPDVKDWIEAHPQFIEADKINRARAAYNGRTDKLRSHDEGAEAKKALKAQEQGMPDGQWALRHPAQVRWYDEHLAADPGPASDDPSPAASDPEREERRQAVKLLEQELKNPRSKPNQELQELLARADGKERALINVHHRDRDAYRNLNCMAKPQTDFPEHTISEATLVLKKEAAFQAHRCLQLSSTLDQDERDQKAWERLRKMVQTKIDKAEIDKAEGSQSVASLQSLQEQCCHPPRAAAVREPRGPAAMPFSPSRTVRGSAAASKGSQAKRPELLPPPLLPVAPLPQRTATHRPVLLPPLMLPPALPGDPVGL
jgi:hypothetical protein